MATIRPIKKIIPKIPGLRPPGPDPAWSAADKTIKTIIIAAVAKILDAVVIRIMIKYYFIVLKGIDLENKL
jgi:hypothetical protein